MISIKNYRLLLLCCMAAINFSSCAILQRDRKIANISKLEKNDFGLPLFVYPALNPLSNKMVVLLSGDGGWLDFDHELAKHFSDRGYNTVGFNSRSYFWEQKTVEQTADDFILLIRRYGNLWKSKKIVLCGYSFGADVTPFIYNRLPADIKNKVDALELLSPFLSTDFVVNLFDSDSDDKPYKVKSELEKVNIPVYCFYGMEEYPKSLNDFKQNNFSIKLVPGDHHYQDAYHQIISAVGHIK